MALSPTPDCYQESIRNSSACAIQACDSGKMDKFDLTTGGSLEAYGQLGGKDILNYWTYARRFTLADRYFTSVHGPSFPNHLFTVAAQSAGVFDNENNATFGTDCTRALSGTVPVMDDNGKVTQQCFEIQTFLDELRLVVNGPLLNEQLCQRLIPPTETP